MKINKALTRLEGDIEKISDSLHDPIQSIWGFIKRHKKVLIAAGAIYLVYRYLFSERKDENY